MQKDHDLIIEIHTNVTAILEQCKKTNGRVTALESWRNYIAGGLALFCILGLPIAWFIVEDTISTHNNIMERVANLE